MIVFTLEQFNDCIQKYAKNNISEKFHLNIEIVEQFYKYYLLVEKWNKYTNLTTIENQEAFIERHFIDALVGISYIAPAEQVIDAGSGVGFPGVVAAICWPNSRVAFVESNRKKCSFLRVVQLHLGLANAEVWCKRIEDVPPQKMVLSRAAFSHVNSSILSQAVAEKGQLILWLSRSDVEEWNRILLGRHFKVEREISYCLSGHRARTIMFYRFDSA